MKKIVILSAIILGIVMTTKAQVTGDWKGALNVQGMELELVFHVSGDNGELTTTLDVPMQGATGVPVEKTLNSLSKWLLCRQNSQENSLMTEKLKELFRKWEWICR